MSDEATAHHAWDYLTAAECVARIRERTGRTVQAATWRTYAHRGEAPAVHHHVGRTPVWDSADVDTYIEEYLADPVRQAKSTHRRQAATEETA